MTSFSCIWNQRINAVFKAVSYYTGRIHTYLEGVWKSCKEEMEHDPYCLCQESIRIDFVRADAIAEQFNTPQDDFFVCSPVFCIFYLTISITVIRACQQIN